MPFESYLERRENTDSTINRSIDRLWWLWQVQDPFHRNEQYSGMAWHGETTAASMDDIISLGGYLAPDVKLYDLMATNYGGIICYNYTITQN